jgi:Zn finger protein HypA/HybF involved in hydrogenase expression|tara:strand:+ start:138 stop:350 length:213 start_codon:yes stop_codon:yes gene_type:complete
MNIKINNMAVDLRCPSCGENLGKDVENENPAYCDTCGQEDIDNPRGYIISCCGDEVDQDWMICPTCKEHV